MRSASARDSGTVGYSTAHRAMPTVSGTAYSISERFADGLGNGALSLLYERPRIVPPAGAVVVGVDGGGGELPGC